MGGREWWWWWGGEGVDGSEVGKGSMVVRWGKGLIVIGYLSVDIPAVSL